MKFIVSSDQLLYQIQILHGVVNSKNTLPILDNFLFELENKQLSISASDLETTMTTTIEVESDSEGCIAVPAHLLLETLKTFPSQPLTFKLEEGNIVEISSSFGKYDMAYFDGEDFPKASSLESPDSIEIKGKILSTAISKTIFATGNDDLRPALTGVFFQFNSDGISFVATDAHKLVKYSRSDVFTEDSFQFIMPKKPLNIIKGILSNSESDVVIEFNESNAKFIFDNVVLVCRLINAKYPNYEAVLPTDNPNVLKVERTTFLNSVRRISIFASQSSHQIRLKMAGTELQISAEDIDFSNKGDERIVCDYQGEDMTIGFNSRFLSEMLSNLDAKEVMIEMSLPNRAGILSQVDEVEEGENIIMLVMPVMLNN